MEPADIDWKRVVSRFVRDEAYENIDAPRWLDLAADAAGAAQVDDEAFFCRPDCRHPKTFEDFQRSEAQSPKAKLLRSSSERLPFGERSNTLRDANNVKRRAGVAPFLPSSPLKPKAVKKFRDDLENQDPNQSTPPPPPRADRNKLGAQKMAKEAIKSSAEKKVEEERREWQQQKRPQAARLRATMSARNLFSGRDILSQISEFCQELKKMAVGLGKASSPEEEVKKKEENILKASPPVVAEDRELLTPKKGSGSVKKSSKMELQVEIGKPKVGLGENSAVLKEVRAVPPTPQRFPSPSTHGFKKNVKSAVDTKSPLNKPSKSSTQENKEEKRSLLHTNSEEGSSGDLFWFFKPCTYMVK